MEQAGVSANNLALLIGSGGPDTTMIAKAAEVITSKKGRLPVSTVPRSMSSTLQANLQTTLGIEAGMPGITSACATSLHAIGEAAELITAGRVDRVLVGGGEGLYLETSIGFDKIKALSHRHNQNPETASRPYSIDRDGFVIGSGSGMVVLEKLGLAQVRGAKILAEIVGYGINSDGALNMTNPNPDTVKNCIKAGLQHVDPEDITYINTHGTSTPNGDIAELKAYELALGERALKIPMSSTKALQGHLLGAAGVTVFIHCVLAMRDGFIPLALNIDKIDPEAARFNIAQAVKKSFVEHGIIVTSNFGFGGTNGVLAMKKWQA